MTKYMLQGYFPWRENPDFELTMRDQVFQESDENNL